VNHWAHSASPSVVPFTLTMTQSATRQEGQAGWRFLQGQLTVSVDAALYQWPPHRRDQSQIGEGFPSRMAESLAPAARGGLAGRGSGEGRCAFTEQVVEDGLVDLDREILEPELRTGLRAQFLLRAHLRIFHLRVDTPLAVQVRGREEGQFGAIVDLDVGAGAAAGLLAGQRGRHGGPRQRIDGDGPGRRDCRYHERRGRQRTRRHEGGRRGSGSLGAGLVDETRYGTVAAGRVSGRDRQQWTRGEPTVDIGRL